MSVASITFFTENFQGKEGDRAHSRPGHASAPPVRAQNLAEGLPGFSLLTQSYGRLINGLGGHLTPWLSYLRSRVSDYGNI
jgi:hypothetical protein